MKSDEDLHLLSCGGTILSFRWAKDSLLPAADLQIANEKRGYFARGNASAIAVGRQINTGDTLGAAQMAGAVGYEGKVTLIRVDTVGVIGTSHLSGGVRCCTNARRRGLTTA